MFDHIVFCNPIQEPLLEQFYALMSEKKDPIPLWTLLPCFSWRHWHHKYH